METLVISAVRTASGNSGALALPNLAYIKAAVMQLEVTAAATGSGDKLNAWVQHSVDGTNYDDFVKFTEVLGDGGAKRHLATWVRDMAPESELKAQADASLAAGVLQGPVGSGAWRVKWVITDAGTGVQSFTFSVTASILYDERARAGIKS